MLHNGKTIHSIVAGRQAYRFSQNDPPQVEFLDKNNDALHASLEQLIGVSKDVFIKTLFPEAAQKSQVNTKKLALISVASKFRVRRLKISTQTRKFSEDFQ